MLEIERLNALAADGRLAQRGSVAEILVIADERSCAYANPQSELLRRTLRDSQNHLARIGAPADHILFDDLPRIDAQRYRLVLFLNCYHIDERQRDSLNRLKSNGRHLVWYGSPGLFTGNRRSLDAMESITGFSFGSGLNETPQVRDQETEAARNGSTRVEHRSALRREFRDWTSWYCAEPSIDPTAIRTFARQSGVHLFTETNDVLYTNASIVVIHAASSGTRVVSFPGDSDITDLITGVKWTAKRSIELAIKEKETRLLHWKQASPRLSR
jgi:hypothetical protein